MVKAKKVVERFSKFLVKCSYGVAFLAAFACNGQNSSDSGTTTVFGSTVSKVDGTTTSATNPGASAMTLPDTNTNDSSKNIKPTVQSDSSTASTTVIGQTDKNRQVRTDTKYIWRRGYYFDSSLYNRCAFPSESLKKGSLKGFEVDELFYVRSKLSELSVFRNRFVDVNPYDFRRNASNFEDHVEGMTGQTGLYHQFIFSAHQLGETRRNKTSGSLLAKDLRFKRLLAENYALGINWKIENNGSGSEYYVRYIKERSPLSKTNIENRSKSSPNSSPAILNRGDKLISIEEIGTKPSGHKTLRFFIEDYEVNENRWNRAKMVFKDKLTGKNKEFYFRPWSMVGVPQSTVEDYKIIVDDKKKIGYVNITNFGLPVIGNNFSRSLHNGYNFSDIMHAVRYLYGWRPYQGVDDLIVDLRYAGSGEIEVASQLAYIIGGNQVTESSIFGFFQYNSVHSKFKSSLWRNGVPFIKNCKFRLPCEEAPTRGFASVFGAALNIWNMLYKPFSHSKITPVFNLERVFILTSSETCGVAEVLINGLLGVDFEVILVGTRTCGKPYYGNYYGNCGIKYFVPEFRVLNNKKFGDYFDGFKPENSPGKKGLSVKGCYVEEDLSQELGSEKENLLAAALQYRRDGKCPAIPEKVSNFDSAEIFPSVY